jgi:hypothetical protein
MCSFLLDPHYKVIKHFDVARDSGNIQNVILSSIYGLTEKTIHPGSSDKKYMQGQTVI